jgi:hypothetical protein
LRTEDRIKVIKGRDYEKEDVSNYWITLRKRETTGT